MHLTNPDDTCEKQHLNSQNMAQIESFQPKLVDNVVLDCMFQYNWIIEIPPSDENCPVRLFQPKVVNEAICFFMCANHEFLIMDMHIKSKRVKFLSSHGCSFN